MQNRLTNRYGAGGMMAGLVLAGLVVSTGGCSDAPGSSTETTVAPPDPVVTSQPDRVVEKLPVSLNTVMVAMVNQAADPLWVAAWHNPQTDADWRELERRAVQLELSGTLLSVPGIGPLDEQWVAEPHWQNWAASLREVGRNAFAAVKARDLDTIAMVGGQLVDTCEGCHRDFKLELPTGGQFGELSPTSVDFEAFAGESDN